MLLVSIQRLPQLIWLFFSLDYWSSLCPWNCISFIRKKPQTKTKTKKCNNYWDRQDCKLLTIKILLGNQSDSQNTHNVLNNNQSDCLCTCVFNKHSPRHQKKHFCKAGHVQLETNISSVWRNAFSLPGGDWTIPQHVKLPLSSCCSAGWVYRPRDFPFLSSLLLSSLLSHWCS